MCRKNGRRCKVSEAQRLAANARRKQDYINKKAGKSNGTSDSTGTPGLLNSTGMEGRSLSPGEGSNGSTLDGRNNPNGTGSKSSVTVSANGKSWSAKVVGSFEAPSKRAEELRALGKSTPILHELSPEDSGVFYDKIMDLQKDNKWHASVYVYPQEEYKDMRVFLADDGESGIAMKSDGDIVSVFSSPVAKDRKSANSMIATMVTLGGRKLDCFDTVLPHIYADEGFVETGRDSWNEEYKPEGWDYETYKGFNNGRPDVVYMEYKAPVAKV